MTNGTRVMSGMRRALSCIDLVSWPRGDTRTGAGTGGPRAPRLHQQLGFEHLSETRIVASAGRRPGENLQSAHQQSGIIQGIAHQAIPAAGDGRPPMENIVDRRSVTRRALAKRKSARPAPKIEHISR